MFPISLNVACITLQAVTELLKEGLGENLFPEPKHKPDKRISAKGADPYGKVADAAPKLLSPQCCVDAASVNHFM